MESLISMGSGQIDVPRRVFVTVEIDPQHCCDKILSDNAFEFTALISEVEGKRERKKGHLISSSKTVPRSDRNKITGGAKNHSFLFIQWSRGPQKRNFFFFFSFFFLQISKSPRKLLIWRSVATYNERMTLKL